MNGLLISDLRVSYATAEILKGFSLQVSPGETVALVGKSGSGKSTLLRAICALQPSTDGSVFLNDQLIIRDGLTLYDEWEIRRHIMMVGQNPSLIPHLTTHKNISLGLECVRGIASRDAKEITFAIAEEMGISSVLKNYPEQLSGGELQRANLARAAVLQPEFLLLDEVTSSIDPETTHDVIRALYRLRSLTSEKKQTCIIVTHHLSFAFDFADRIAFLNEGVNYEEGKARAFVSEVKKAATLRFLNSQLSSSSPNKSSKP